MLALKVPLSPLSPLKKKKKKKKKRSRSVADLAPESKRQKTAIDAIVKEYSCPLSLDLPVEPVIAEDGRTYNRADIKRHIDNARDPNDAQDEYKKLRSPVTNQKMGPKLLPAVQVQNMIRSLVESGAIDEDDTKQWKKVDDVRTKANSGDPEAMCKLSDWYYDGLNGFVEDYKLSYSCVKKAADLGHNSAKASVGFMHYTGEGTKQSCVEGALLLGFAAAKGSSNAAYYLAKSYYHGGDAGKGYFSKDNTKAKFWLDEAMRLRKEGDKDDKVDLDMAESLREKLVDEEEEEDDDAD